MMQGVRFERPCKAGLMLEDGARLRQVTNGLAHKLGVVKGGD